METYFNLPHIGELLLEHTFYTFDDEPILFVCQDRTGLRYLCSCCRLYEEWVIGQISEIALIDLVDDKVTIRATFQNSCDPQFFVIWDGKQFGLNFDFSDNLLPKEGSLLELEREKSGLYRKTLENDIRLQSMLKANSEQM